MADVLGLDIGGANLKAVHTCGAVRFRPFALWKNPEKLPAILVELVAGLPAFDVVALTMTGELCDCFATKRQGVQAIVAATAELAGQRRLRVWSTAGFLDAAGANAKPMQVAAANWLALATHAGRLMPEGSGVVIDIGSTTTDIIPVASGRPTPRGLTDTERLRNLELVYTGVRRTPLCAVLGGGVAAEVFATTLDVYLVLGDIAEDAADHETADGRPATIAAAHARLARMLRGDAETCSRQETTKLANYALLRQVDQLTVAFDDVISGLSTTPATVVLAGEGEFLARWMLAQQKCFDGGQVISLTERWGADRSRAACAYAVAALASEI